MLRIITDLTQADVCEILEGLEQHHEADCFRAKVISVKDGRATVELDECELRHDEWIYATDKRWIFDVPVRPHPFGVLHGKVVEAGDIVELFLDRIPEDADLSVVYCELHSKGRR